MGKKKSERHNEGEEATGPPLLLHLLLHLLLPFPGGRRERQLVKQALSLPVSRKGLKYRTDKGKDLNQEGILQITWTHPVPNHYRGWGKTPAHRMHCDF